MIQRVGSDRKTGDDEGDTNYIHAKKKISVHVTNERDFMVYNIGSSLGPTVHSQSRDVFHSDQ